MARGEARPNGSNLCLLNFANQAPIERPGGSILYLCFQNKPSTPSGSEGVFLHFRGLDESTLSKKDRDTAMSGFWYHEVKFPTGYSRKKQQKLPSGEDEPPAVAQRADIVQPRCDWGLIKSWLDDCISLHEHPIADAFLSATQKGPSLLIYTQRHCVVNARPDFTYAALSYVWGLAHGLLKCTKSTKESLMREKSRCH